MSKFTLYLFISILKRRAIAPLNYNTMDNTASKINTNKTIKINL